MKSNETSIPTVQWKHLGELIAPLKADGWRVAAATGISNVPSWLIIAKGDVILNLEANRFHFNLGTVHKPCKDFGTGFGLIRDAYEMNVATINEKAKLFHTASRGYRGDYSKLKYYSSLDEYIKAQEWAHYMEF